VLATRAAVWGRVGVVPAAVAVALVPWWWSLGAGYPPDPSDAVAAVPVVAAALAWRSVRSSPRGPQIHDRQLDLIVSVLAAAAAVELLVLAHHAADSVFAALGSCLVAVAIIAAGWGSRALWTLRWAVGLLALAWRAPWVAVTGWLSPGADAAALHLARVVTPGGSVSVAAGGGSGWGGSVLAVSHSAGAVAVDPMAGGGVLMPFYVGTLCGVAGSFCVAGAARRAGMVVAGVAVGLALAALTWILVVWRAHGVGAAAGADWSSGVTDRFAVLALLAVLVLVGVVAGLPHGGHRAGPGQERARGRRLVGRLAIAVPRARVGTTVVLVLAVGFLLLGMWTPPMTTTATSTATRVMAAGIGPTSPSTVWWLDPSGYAASGWPEAAPRASGAPDGPLGGLAAVPVNGGVAP